MEDRQALDNSGVALQSHWCCAITRDYNSLVKEVVARQDLPCARRLTANWSQTRCFHLFHLDERFGAHRGQAYRCHRRGKDIIAVLTEEVASLNAGIAALYKSVAEAAEQGKDENSDYTTLMANDAAAADILAMAKNRLNKFYKPKLYKEPEAAPAFVQVSAHKQLDAPLPSKDETAFVQTKRRDVCGAI